MAAESLFLQAPVGSGLPVAAPRTNLVTNPSFEADTAGWTLDATGWASAGQYRAGPISPVGTFKGRFALYMGGTKDATATLRFLDATMTVAVAPSTSYTLSAAAYVADAPNPAGGSVTVAIEWYTAGDAYISSSFGTAVATNGAYRLTCTATSPGTAAKAILYLRVYTATSGDTTAAFFDSVLFETGSTAEYFDGTSIGCEWTGLPNLSTSVVSPTLSLTDQTVWKVEDFDLDNPVPRDVFVAESDRDGSRPAAEPRWDNRQPSFGLRMTPQATGDNMLSKITALEDYLAAARRIAKDGPVDPANYVRLVWTPADSTKTYFLPVYSGRITEINRDDPGWVLKTPKLTVDLVCDPAGYGAWTTLLAATSITANFIGPVVVPGGAGDLPPWAKVTLTEGSGSDKGIVRAGVKTNDGGTFNQIAAGSIVVTNYDSTVSSGFVIYNTWTDGLFRAIGALPAQTVTGRFKVFALACSGNLGVKIRFSYATKNGSRRVLSAVDASNTYQNRDVCLGEINVDSGWNGWLETNGIAGQFWGIALMPIDSYCEAVEPAAGENLAGASVQVDEFGTGATHLSGKSLDAGTGTWALSGTNIASPTWPVSSSMAWRQVVSNAAPAFARAGSNNVLNGSYKARLLMTYTNPFTETQDRPHLGVFARYSSITNFMVAGYNLSSPGASTSNVTPGVWLCVGGTYYRLFTGVPTDLAPTNGGLFDVELQTAADGRWWCRWQAIAADNVTVLSSQEASGSHGILRSGGTLGGATVGHGLFDWKQTSSAFIRGWQDYRQRNLVGLTPLPLQANKDLAWNDAVLLADGGSGEYPYAGASGFEFQPGVNNGLNLMVRKNSVANDLSAGAGVNDVNTTVKVEAYPRFLTVPR